MNNTPFMPLDVDYIVVIKRQEYYSVLLDVELVYGDQHHRFKLDNALVSPERGVDCFIHWFQQVVGKESTHIEIDLLKSPSDTETHSLWAWARSWQS